MTAPTTISFPMTLERATKGTYVYTAPLGNPVTALYVRRETFTTPMPPRDITVTIATDEQN